MRITTIPVSFSLLTLTEGYAATQVLPTPFRITRLYIMGEPTPSQLLLVRIYKWAGGTLPTVGSPSGATIFDDLVIAPNLRVGRIPIDISCDILIERPSMLLVYANNGSTATQQCDVFIEVAFP